MKAKWRWCPFFKTWDFQVPSYFSSRCTRYQPYTPVSNQGMYGSWSCRGWRRCAPRVYCHQNRIAGDRMDRWHEEDLEEGQQGVGFLWWKYPFKLPWSWVQWKTTLKWKETNIGGIHFPLPCWREEGLNPCESVVLCYAEMCFLLDLFTWKKCTKYTPHVVMNPIGRKWQIHSNQIHPRNSLPNSPKKCHDKAKQQDMDFFASPLQVFLLAATLRAETMPGQPGNPRWWNHTLLKTNSSPLKWMVGRWNVLLGWPIFRGYVSFGEGGHPKSCETIVILGVAPPSNSGKMKVDTESPY